MTEIPATPIEPTPTSSRRPLRVAVAAGFFAVAAGFFAIVVAFFGVQVALSASKADPVVLHTSEAEGYSVMAPGEPTVEVSTAKSGRYDLASIKTTWAVGTEGKYVAYSVQTTDFSVLALQTDLDPDAILDVWVERAHKIIPGATVRAMEESTLFGERAVSGVLNNVDGSSHRFMMVFHNYVQYTLLVMENHDDRDENFLASFTLLD